MHHVGPTRSHISPNALYLADLVEQGDTIDIDQAEYFGEAALAVWDADDLLIRGMGGQPHLVVDGQYIRGKGIWVLVGDNIRVENIEFSGARVPDLNGAGIRLDGSGLTVRHCYFHHCENGILTNNTGAGHILIEHCEFADNGAGDGQSHNVYVGRVAQLTFQYNYSHHAVIGHNLKSRAQENLIWYNRIMDEETGNSSRLIDLPSGGLAIVMGNILMQGPDAPNNNLIGYGLEGLTNAAPHEIYIVNNTLVNERQASCLFVSLEAGLDSAYITNNVFAGGGELVRGPVTEISHNLEEDDISQLGFVDEMIYDYDINSASPAVDYGATQDSVRGYSLTPEMRYVHPMSFDDRSTRGSSIDAGAYESESTVSSSHVSSAHLLLYPNPTHGVIKVNTRGLAVEQITTYDMHGAQVAARYYIDTVDLQALPSGIYLLEILLTDGTRIMRKLLKK